MKEIYSKNQLKLTPKKYFPPILIDDCMPLEVSLFTRTDENLSRIVNIFDSDDLRRVKTFDYCANSLILRLYKYLLLEELRDLGLADLAVILSYTIDLSDQKKIAYNDAALAIEVSSKSDIKIANELSCELIIAKGFESPGPSSELSAFVLYQLLSKESKHPYYIYGDTAYELFQSYLVNGVSGIVIAGNQFISSDFSKMRRVKIGDQLSIRLNITSAQEIEKFQDALSPCPAKNLKTCFEDRLWGNNFENLLVERAAEILEYLQIYNYMSRKRPSPCFIEASLGARNLSVKYPVIQGPMANITLSPEFAGVVYNQGAFPILALAGQTLETSQQIVKATAKKDIPFGVGIVAVGLDDELFKALIELFEEAKPTMVLVGTPQLNHVTRLLKTSLNVFVHAPTLAIFKSLYKMGLRNFVIEGEEAGGHVSRTSSLSSWQAILHEIRDRSLQSQVHIVFAGGIYQQEASSLISSMLRYYGVRNNMAVSLQLGTAFLSSSEILSKNKLSPEYQSLLLSTDETAVTGEHFYRTVRQLKTDYVQQSNQEELRLLHSDNDFQDQKNDYSKFYRGGLKRAVLSEGYNPDGCYQAGAIATCINRQSTIAEIISSVLQLEEESETKDELDDAIAIVGVSCLLPGAKEVKQHFRNLMLKRCFIKEATIEALDQNLYYSNDRDEKNTSYTNLASLIDAFDRDLSEFRIPPSVAKEISNIQVLTLKCTKSALADAGFFNRPFSKERTSVFLGSRTNRSIHAEEKLNWLQTKERLSQMANSDSQFIDKLSALFDDYEAEFDDWDFTEDTLPGELESIISSRICSTFDFKGSSNVIAAACASSLASMTTAMTMLQNNRCDVAISGGAQTDVNSKEFIEYASIQALSSVGSFPFEERSDGFVLGEGAVIYVMKRYKDALLHGDQIYALVRGWGSSSDGAGKAIAAPDSEGQLRALQAAYEDANIDPKKIHYLEAHGTGTAVGDKTEYQTYEQFFGNPRIEADLEALRFGTSKATLGHVRTGAGAIGTLSTLFAINTGFIPPQTNFEKPGKAINNAGLKICPRPVAINSDRSEITAGVSAFGFGGINYHLILSGSPKNQKPPIIDTSIGQFKQIDSLTSDLAFLFPGQGSQFPGMLAAFKDDPEVNELMQRAETIFGNYNDAPLRDLLFTEANPDEQTAREEKLKETAITQPALFLTSAVLINKIKALNISPAMVIGHSLGEYCALYASELLSFDDAFRLVCIRGQVMAKKTDKQEAMLSLKLDQYIAESLIKEIDGYLSCANFNAYNQTIISGELDAIDKLYTLAKQRDIACIKLNVNRGFHSQLVSDCVTPMENALAAVSFNYPTVPIPANISRDIFPFDSEKTGTQMSKACRQKTIELLEKQIDNPVDFISQINLAYESGIRRFIELGPKSILCRLTDSILDGRPVQTNFILTENSNPYELLEDLATRLNEDVKIKRSAPPHSSSRKSKPKQRTITKPDRKAQMSISESIRQVVMEVSGYEAEQINDDSEFERDLGIDSLKMFEILAYLRGSILPEEITNFRELTSLSKIRKVAETYQLDQLVNTDGDNDEEDLDCYKFKMKNMGTLNTTFDSANSYFIDESLLTEKEHGQLHFPKDTKSNKIIILHKQSSNNPSLTILLAELLVKIQGYLDRFENDKNAQIHIISFCAQDDYYDSAFYSETGFIRSAANDNPDYQFTYSHIDRTLPNENDIRAIVNERIIGLHLNSDGQKFEGRLYEVDGIFATAESLPQHLTANDTILFTGGAKGIGASISAYLLANSSVNLIIAGRQSKPEPWILDYPERVKYLSMDVCDLAAMETLKLNEMGINLVFHSAGVVKRNHFRNKTKEEVVAVMDTKAKGLDNLIDSIGDSLEGLILFSSTNSHKGNFGQADYAAANAVLNGRNRSGLPTLAICWAAWGEVGLASSGIIKDILTTSGASLIKTKPGVEMFAKLLSGFLQSPPQGTATVAVAGPKQPGYFMPEEILIKKGQEPLLKNYSLSDPDQMINEAVLMNFEENQVIKEHVFSDKIIMPGCIMLRSIFAPMLQSIVHPQSQCLKLAECQFFMQFATTDNELKQLNCYRQNNYFKLELEENGKVLPIFSTCANPIEYSKALEQKHQDLLTEMQKEDDWQLLPLEARNIENPYAYTDEFGDGFKVLNVSYNGKIFKNYLPLDYAINNPSILTRPAYIPYLLESVFQLGGRSGYVNLDNDNKYMPKSVEAIYIFEERCHKATETTAFCKVKEQSKEIISDIIVINQDNEIILCL
ncbi:MAG: SDR family NAD(P)-dependent oxidoreductase, partial [Lentisphaeria bacterium]|nr:SDR family NAD(P)-dependent oxidoreductase [Lentisphaeria bacterium]NQZ70979.1 SDR family NAD(P)-dependent oxidoreductase [Lentisphaeria bacterium]